MFYFPYTQLKITRTEPSLNKTENNKYDIKNILLNLFRTWLNFKNRMNQKKKKKRKEKKKKTIKRHT